MLAQTVKLSKLNGNFCNKGKAVGARWVMGGDFNDIKGHKEKNEGREKRTGM